MNNNIWLEFKRKEPALSNMKLNLTMESTFVLGSANKHILSDEVN